MSEPTPAAAEDPRGRDGAIRNLALLAAFCAACLKLPALLRPGTGAPRVDGCSRADSGPGSLPSITPPQRSVKRRG